MRSWSPNIQRQYAILFLVILTFVFPVALHAAARTSNTVTMTGTTVVGSGTQAVSTSSAVAGPVISFANGFAGSQSKVILTADAQQSGSAIQSLSPIIDCPSGFASTGACGVANIGASGKPFQIAGSGASPALSGSRVLLIPTRATHAGLSLNYQTQVNVQAFTSRFTFVPNGQNIAFVIQNSTNNPFGFNGPTFTAGAGCEAGFFQGFSQRNPPNDVFALELDSYSPLTGGGSFTYSSAQIYTSDPYVQCPCMGGAGVCGTNNSDTGNITKISTSPVPLNSPVDVQNTTTGDTYSATVTYDGSKLTLNLYDVTAGGSCARPNCFTYTWNNVDIPAWVGGNTAWVGFTAATGLTSDFPLYVESLVYTPLTSKRKQRDPEACPTPPVGWSWGVHLRRNSFIHIRYQPIAPRELVWRGEQYSYGILLSD
jgi:hypothetical protein